MATAKKTATKKPAARKSVKKNKPVPSDAGSIEIGQASSAGLPESVADPIGDETDGEAASLVSDEGKFEAAAPSSAAAGMESQTEPPAAQTAQQPALAEPGDAEGPTDAILRIEPDAAPEVGGQGERAAAPPAKLERLQKILSRAGVASRRAAETMIMEGRVQVNGAVVTTLGSKADPERDHIRADGKLLHGAERLRYFVLNKPKGYVTTVKDPEGRPTVMHFFEKMRERLYPVGRLDYQSEGLLLVTNDGDLANRLTKASSGVEKTYLVKVAGIPAEEDLDRLRAGVSIDKGKPGEERVRTSPARIRQVRQGENPWYEVVLVEGRNRELRKMFEAIGRFVEKIRRVGYGPLVLDQEPGDFRELDEQELALLRKAADGTLRKSKDRPGMRVKFLDSLEPPKPVKPHPAARTGGANTRAMAPIRFGSGGTGPERRGAKPMGRFSGQPGRPFAPKPANDRNRTGSASSFNRPWKRQSEAPRERFGQRNAGTGSPSFKGAPPRPVEKRPQTGARRDSKPGNSSRLRIEPIDGPGGRPAEEHKSAGHQGKRGEFKQRPLAPRPFTPAHGSGREGALRSAGGRRGFGDRARGKAGPQQADRSRTDSRPARFDRQGGGRPGQPSQGGSKGRSGGRPGGKRRG